MTRPTRKCVFLLIAGIPAALLPAIVLSELWVAWVLGFAFLLLIFGLDLLGCPREVHLAVRTQLPSELYIGETGYLVVRIRAAEGLLPVAIDLRLELDEDLAVSEIPPVTLTGGEETEARITLTPRRRGSPEVAALWLRWRGRRGLVERIVRHEVATAVPVVPNRRAVKAAALRLFRDPSFLAGLKTERYMGDGSEFNELREYTAGLDPRAMDWKASARHLKLIARSYKAERNHQVVIAIDTGHLMREPIEGIPRLDHAINAGLLLGFTCLKTGDRVGLFAFDEKVRLHSQPRGGLASFAHLASKSAGLDYSTAETNFTLGLMTLSGRLKRRTLIVLFTEFVDTVTVELMLDNLRRLSTRHLVLCVTLTDPELRGISGAAPRSLLSLSRSVVAGELLRDREVVLRRIRRMGVHCLDTPAAGVATGVVARYLEIKRKELL